MDILGTFLSSFKNAQTRKKSSFYLPYSKYYFALLTACKEEGYIQDFSLVQDSKTQHSRKRVFLNKFHVLIGNRSIDIQRISTPTRPVYKQALELNRPPYLEGLRTYFVSTSRGILSARMAVQYSCGGQLLFSLF
jgi:small subunit ribosomal protein S8